MASNPVSTTYRKVYANSIFGQLAANDACIILGNKNNLSSYVDPCFSTDGVAFTIIDLNSFSSIIGEARTGIPVAITGLAMFIPKQVSPSTIISVYESLKFNGSTFIKCGRPPNTTSSYLSGTVYYPFDTSGANDKIFTFHDVEGNNTNAVFYTSDGTNWTEINVPVGSHNIYDPKRSYHKMYYKAGTYYLLSKEASYYTSTNLTAWTEHRLYDPYLVTGEILQLFLTNYGGVDEIFFLDGTSVRKIESETNGVVTSSLVSSSSNDNLLSSVGGGIVCSFNNDKRVYYYNGDGGFEVSGLIDLPIGATVSAYLSCAIFNGSLFVNRGPLYAGLYNASWTSGDSATNLYIVSPTAKKYFIVDGSSASLVTGEASAVGGVAPYTWSGAASSVSADGSDAYVQYGFSQVSIGNPYLPLLANVTSFQRQGDAIVVMGMSYSGGTLLGVQISPQDLTFGVTDSQSPVPDSSTGSWRIYPKLSSETNLVDSDSSSNLTVTASDITVTVDEAYSQSLGTVSGGDPPYTWTLSSKTWADAATVSTAGVLATTITVAGDYTLIVDVEDSSQTPLLVTKEIAVSAVASPYTATIQGTLRLDTTDGAFAARSVHLYNYTTGDKVASTTSNGTTGEWEFTQVAPGEYFVVGAAQGDDLNVPRDFDAMGVITVT